MIERQELVEILVRPSASDALEGSGEPGERIHLIHPGGLQQRGDGRPCVAAAVGTGEERILAGDGLRPDSALDGVVVDVVATIGEEAFASASFDLPEMRPSSWTLPSGGPPSPSDR